MGIYRDQGTWGAGGSVRMGVLCENGGKGALRTEGVCRRQLQD